MVDFTGAELSWEFVEAFPHGLPIAADGSGNFWVVDLHPDAKDWSPTYFACHDAPVILVQSHSLEHFLTELLRMSGSSSTSAVDDVHEDRLFEVWATNPSVLTVEACLESEDPAVAAFARELGPGFQLIDLRGAPVGMGFSWGRYGPNTEVRRNGKLPLFAYKKPPSLWAKLKKAFT